jgi:hypothetical protein
MAVLWLVAWLAVGGLLLYRAVPKKHDTLATSSAPRVQLARATAKQPPSPYRTKNIEDVRAGEWVWSCDPVTGAWSRGQVVRPLVHDYAGDVVTVAAGGERIEATGNHPFWVVTGEGLSARPDPHDVPSAERDALRESTSGRWVEARSLQPGDLLLLRSGATATVEELYSRQVEQKVYNLEVADLHTYAVGGDGVLVHNKALQARPIVPRRDVVYRVIRVDEDISAGIVAKNPTATYEPAFHVARGSKYPTQYISATTDLAKAQEILRKYGGGGIVEIQLSKLPGEVAVYDFSNAAMRNQYLKFSYTARNAAKWNEFLIEGRVPASAVRRVK